MTSDGEEPGELPRNSPGESLRSEPGEVHRGWWIAGIAVRVALLLILLWGALVVVLSMSPTPRTLPEFRASLAAGRISAVSYRVTPGGRGGEVYEYQVPPRKDGGEVSGLKWSEGPLRWHRLDRLPLFGASGVYTLDRLRDDTAASTVRAVQETDSSPGWWYARWPFDVPALLGLWWVGAAWAATFLIMIGSTPRLGNRWAWFWMFGVGQVGAIAFLLLEPRPLWYRHGRRPPPRRRLEGGLGCLTSIVLSVAATAAAVAVGELVNAVLP
ncbi:hypothetical protein [Streptomyces anulatus]|uniref:hypothetical protein n=1 Tax=Streptomyces anulatus TaxID=1892 RepID=UPI003421495B